MTAPLLEVEDLEIGGPTPLRIPHFHARTRHLGLVEEGTGLRSALLLALVRRPTLGRFRKFLIDGVPLTEALPSGVVGYVPRTLGEEANATALEALRASATLLGLGAREARRALEAVGLGELGKTPLVRLTRLDHRLLGLAHGLLGAPRTLVFEPVWHGLTRPELDHLERLTTGLLGRLRCLVLGGTGTGSEREFLEALGAFARLSESGLSDPKPLRGPSAFRVVVADGRERFETGLVEEGLSVERCLRPDMLVISGAEPDRLLRVAERTSVALLEMEPDGPLGASAGLV